MDQSNRKRRGGGLRGKLAMSFNRALKPSVQQLSKVNPSPSSSASLDHHHHHELVVPSPKAYSMVKNIEKRAEVMGGYSEETASEVDKKAESYISCVQERFRMERGDDDRRKY